MPWEIQPEPDDDAERDALLAAAEAGLDGEVESAWWRSGLDDLGGPPAEELRSDPRVVEP
jgi:hypothetical protein